MTTTPAMPELLRTSITPRPLRYSLNDYHNAPSEGPLHATWEDKPHRLLYDLIAAVSYYSALQAQQSTQGDTPAAAEVSDVIAMVRERYRGTKWGKAAECICDAVDEAILALLQQAVPMT